MKRADFIVIAAVLAAVGVLCIFLYGVNSGSGSAVQVEIDGKVTQTLPLNEDAEITITTENGGENTLVIQNGCAFVTEANCPDGICKRHAKISRSGESIICLPHKVVISITDNRNDNEIDLAG